MELLGSVQALDDIIQSTALDGNSVTGSRYWDQIAIGGPVLLALGGLRLTSSHYVHLLTLAILLATVVSYASGFAGIFLTLAGWQMDNNPSFQTLGSNHSGLTGLSLQTLRSNAWPDWSDPVVLAAGCSRFPSQGGMRDECEDVTTLSGAPAVLALLFPMFLGVFQGANNAANLRRPSDSIVKGTLLAILTSTVLYRPV